MLRNKLQQFIKKAIQSEFHSHSIDNVSVSRTSQSDHGDYSTNIAMISAKTTGKLPHDVASTLVRSLQDNNDLSEIILNIQIAGPGFINFYIKDEVIWS